MRKPPLLITTIVLGLLSFMIVAVLQARFQSLRNEYKRFIVVFAEPDMITPVAAVPSSDREILRLESDGELRGFRAKMGSYIPMIRWAPVYAASPGPGISGFVAPDLEYTYEWFVGMFKSPSMDLASNILTALCLTLGIWFVCKTSTPSILAGLVFLRLSSLLWAFALFGFYTIHAGDESYSYDIARKLLDWNYPLGPNPAVIGNSLIYLPFLLGLREVSEFCFVALCSFFYFIVFGIGTIVGIYWFVKRLTGSVDSARLAAVICILYPWLTNLHHKPNGLFTYLGVNAFYPIEISRMELYYLTDFLGYNAMTDSPAFFFGMLGIGVFFRSMSTENTKTLFLTGLILGFSCTIRLANIYYLVPLAFYFLFLDIKHFKGRLLSFSSSFGLALIPQLLWNWKIYGNPLTLGYKGYSRAYAGFEISNLISGIEIYGMAHQQLIALAALALVIGYTNYRPLVVFFSLLILPTLIFYSGFFGIDQNPVRYILMPLTAMCASITLLFVPGSCSRQRLILSLSAVSAAMIGVPGSSYLAFMIPGAGWISSVLVLAIALVCWKCCGFDWRYMVFFLILAVGSPILTFCYISCVCLGNIMSVFWIKANDGSRITFQELTNPAATSRSCQPQAGDEIVV